MPEPEAPPQKALSRRDVLRRGAIAGGTLLWAAPVIQSIRTPAYAASGIEGCCQCSQPPPFPGVLQGVTCAQCADYCSAHGGVSAFTRGTGCIADSQACVPTATCPQVPCAWESHGPQRLKRIKKKKKKKR